MFHVGDRVICIHGEEDYDGVEAHLVVGEIYTVREVIIGEDYPNAGYDPNEILSIALIEFENEWFIPDIFEISPIKVLSEKDEWEDDV